MHWSRITWIALLLLPSLAKGQQGRAPDPHWGAEIYPRDEYEWRSALTFHRFTRFSSTSLASGKTFNEDIDKSAGFNLLSVQHTDEIDFDRRHKWTYTWNLGAGYMGDEPTQTLQNDYMHSILGQGDVPTLADETGFLWTAGLAVNCWFGAHSFIHRDGTEPDDESFRFSGVIGLGGVASSLYYEPEVHAGLALDFPRYNLRLTGLHRYALPIGGEVYRDVADDSQVSQASLYYIPDNFYTDPSIDSLWEWENLLPHRWLMGLHDLIGRPRVGVHMTHDTGLFEDTANNGISTWFISGSFEWSTGVRVEVWNDILNGTDHGPTFGMTIGFDVMTLYNKLGGRK